MPSTLLKLDECSRPTTQAMIADTGVCHIIKCASEQLAVISLLVVLLELECDFLARRSVSLKSACFCPIVHFADQGRGNNRRAFGRRRDLDIAIQSLTGAEICSRTLLSG